MSEITRYALKHPYRDVIVPSKCGMMVLYSDHAAREAELQQQLSDQRAVIERLEGALLQIQTARRIEGLYHGGETYCGMVSRLQSLAESAIQAAKGTP